MKVRFISHASIQITCGRTNLICDPWTVGKAFNHGWSLLSPAASVDWAEIDYIWISHQHPDHLNFPTLRSIPGDQRARITILYQRHSSPRMVKVFRGLGFRNVIELPLHRWQRVADFDVLCGSVGTMDSWIALRGEGECMLNLNDCIFSSRHLADVRDLVGPVSLLFTQFSFANWIGNHADERGEVKRKLEDLRHRVRLFQPEATVAFASFIYFCNQENCWLNNFAITPQQVLDLGLPNVNFMYPGDEWDSSRREFNTEEAVRRYAADTRRMTIDPTPATVPVNVVLSTAKRMVQTLEARFGRLLVRRLEPVEIFLHDHDCVLRIVPSTRSCEIAVDPGSKQNARYRMCSQVAWFTLAYSWGWGAMEVSGMYSDREHLDRGEHRIAFFLNLLSTDFINLRGIRQCARTGAFLWTKRREISYRLLGKWGLRRRPETTSFRQLPASD
jgi:UDP-MurNAc hydroxylase